MFGCLETSGNYIDYEGGYATVGLSDAVADGTVAVIDINKACAVDEGHFIPETMSDMSDA